MSHGCCSIAVKHAYFATEPSTHGNPGWEQIVEDIEYWAEMSAEAIHPATWTPPAWYTNQTDAEIGQRVVDQCLRNSSSATGLYSN